MSLLDQITEAVGASGALGDLPAALGTSATETDSLVGAAIPAVLAGLGLQATEEGAGALAGLFGDDDGSFLDGLGSFFGNGDRSGLASKLVGSIFGSQRSAMEAHVAGQSGGALSAVTRLLPMITPTVLGFLSKLTKDESLDAAGISERLGSIGADGPTGDILAKATDEDRSEFVTGVAALRDAGGLAALLPVGTMGTAAAAAAAAPVAAAGLGTDATRYEDDDDRTGLAWLLPLLVPLGLLILGLVLWQCTGSDDADVAAPVEVVEEEPEPQAEAEVEDEVEVEPEAAPAAEPTAEPEPEPTAEPEPEPTAEPEPESVTIADLALGSDDLSTLVGLATQLGLADAIADADAGPFTVFAPSNDAFDAAGGVLGRLDESQVGTTVTFHVIPQVVTSADLVPGASFETLAGETLTLDADGNLPGGVRIATADLMADNGVVHIVENVLVPGSIQRFLAADDVNQLFLLEPIQFASGSADILPESVPTLDQAIAVLSLVPAGSQFEVQGHTDTDGPDDFNQDLSERRAAAVVAYLTNGGVDADLLTPVGYGETQLKVDPEATPEDKAMNRRIEFVDIS